MAFSTNFKMGDEESSVNPGDFPTDFTSFGDTVTELPPPLVIGGPDYVRDHPEIAVPYLCLSVTASVVGTLGNLCVLGAVVLNPNLRHSRNTFIVNLALADLCVTAIADPFGAVGMLKGKQYFDSRPALCDFLSTVCLMACVTALFSIGGVGFNRYLHICHPNLYRKVFTFRNNILLCFAFWGVGLGFSLPGLVGWTDNVYDHKYLECIWNRLHSLSFTIFFSTCVVALPVGIITYSYACIFLHVHASKRRVAQMQSGSDTQSQAYSDGQTGRSGFKLGVPGKTTVPQKKPDSSSSLKLARTLFAIFMVFVLCWTPYALMVVIDFQDKFPSELHLFILLLAHMHSTINCIVYAMTNVHFRKGYALVLTKLTCGRISLHSGSASGPISKTVVKKIKVLPAKTHPNESLTVKSVSETQ